MSRIAVVCLVTGALLCAGVPAVAAPGSWTVVNTIPHDVPGGQGMEYATALAVDDTRGLVYVSSFYPGDDLDPENPVREAAKIFLVDGRAGVVTDTLDLSCADPDDCNDFLAGMSVATHPATDAVWVTFYGSGTAGYFTGGSTGGLALAHSIPLYSSGTPATPDAMPFAVAVDPDTGLAYISDGDDDSRLSPSGSRVYVVDPATQIVTTYGNDGAFDPGYSGVAIDPATDTMFIPVQQQDYTAAFDVSSGVTELPALQPDPAWGTSLAPTQAALDSTLSRLFVTNVQGNSVSVYDAVSSDPVALLSLEEDSPMSIAVDASRHLLFVGTFGPDQNGRVWVFDTASLTLVDRVDLPALNVLALDVDPVLGHVYVVGVVDTGAPIPGSALFTLAWRAALPNTGTGPDAALALAGALAVMGGALTWAIASRRRRAQA